MFLVLVAVTSLLCRFRLVYVEYDTIYLGDTCQSSQNNIWSSGLAVFFFAFVYLPPPFQLKMVHCWPANQLNVIRGKLADDI